MGLGRTNAGNGSGGGGSAFSATLQVATDANAVITAINLAGDTFSGTANSSGSLTLTITEPGTYTVTETDGGVESIVIADNGATYTLEVTAFDGTMIYDGAKEVLFSSVNVTGSGFISASTTTFSGENALWIKETSNNGSAQYVTSEWYDITEYNSLILRGCRATSLTTYIITVDEQNNMTYIAQLSSLNTNTITLSGYDKTKKYRFGVLLANGNNVYIMSMKLQ